jgi:hypothetical protein
MNELSAIFQVLDVLSAVTTFDPYYLTHHADKASYHPAIILAGRRINDGVGARIARMRPHADGAVVRIPR